MKVLRVTGLFPTDHPLGSDRAARLRTIVTDAWLGLCAFRPLYRKTAGLARSSSVRRSGAWCNFAGSTWGIRGLFNNVDLIDLKFGKGLPSSARPVDFDGLHFSGLP